MHVRTDGGLRTTWNIHIPDISDAVQFAIIASSEGGQGWDLSLQCDTAESREDTPGS